MVVTLKDIAHTLSEDTGIPYGLSYKIVKVTEDIIMQNLYVEKKDVYLHGFGTFKVKTTPERRVRVPDGRYVIIPEKEIVKFVESKKNRE